MKKGVAVGKDQGKTAASPRKQSSMNKTAQSEKPGPKNLLTDSGEPEERTSRQEPVNHAGYEMIRAVKSTRGNDDDSDSSAEKRRQRKVVEPQAPGAADPNSSASSSAARSDKSIKQQQRSSGATTRQKVGAGIMFVTCFFAGTFFGMGIHYYIFVSK